MSENILLQQALDYARRGWYVIPCRPQTILDEDGKEVAKAKAPLTENGFYDASANPDAIHKWWSRWPDALIGISTGPSGLLVVDLDNKHGIDGAANFAEVAVAHGGVPRTYTVRTQSGGKHLYFKRQEGVDVPSKNGWLPNVDVRADTGYIIAPPSKVTGGGAYEIEDLRAIETAPAWLVEALQNPYWSDRPRGEKKNFSGHVTPYAKAVFEGELEAVATCPDGCRNATLNTCAFRLWGWVAGGELSEDEVQAGLEKAAQACGLGQMESLKTIASAKRAGMEHPRNTPKREHLPEEWGAPVPFTAHNLPKLDAANLPPVLGDFCAGLAEEKQVPVEIAVAMSLSTLATAAQGRYVARVREGYTEPLNIYTLCPLEPANRKSATVEACTVPLKEWEKWMAETMAPEVKAARSKRLTMEKTIEAKRNKAAKCATVQEIDDLQKEILALEEQLPEIPVVPRLLADNTTPEALAVLMENMGGCIAIITAEGGIFDILAGMYNKGTPNLDLFLKGHSGDSFRVDRRMAPPVLLDNPRLTLGISPQPITLAERSASKVFRGRGLDGRFLYFMPESLLGRRKLEPSPMSPAAKSRFHDKVRGLLPLRWCQNMPDPMELELSPEAYQIWLAFAGEVEKGLAPGGEFEDMNDWGGKLAGAVARIAGLFHLVTHDRPEELKITPETMRQAAYMGALLTEHAKAAYALMGTDETIEGAKKVLEWIRRQAAERFTVRDCFNGVRSATLFPHVEAVKAALKELEEREFIRELPTENKGPGRKPSPVFLVNPATLRG